MYVWLVILMLFATPAYAKTYEERQAAIKAMVDAEVKRAHELKLEAAKIEVLARIEQLGATEINVESNAYSSSDLTNTIETTNTARNN